ncbi:hypothetical protein KIN20_004948 [Parelaphostrongylus tenuis]|uniref:Uncharacterized protein n=1 Tax=Parelaphostrongylus tenuis TaxID=148309 RepID=A0AAD5MI38_PARTN|nr:hypothetical protein KIN20_004948 [Parelaphostrongylus tenuis]
MPESRPYMSCLRPDDMKEKSFHDDDDEEENDKKEDDDPITLARTGSSIAGGGSGGNESEGQGQAYDNLYLRIAQLQQKEMKILREERKMSS